MVYQANCFHPLKAKMTKAAELGQDTNHQREGSLSSLLLLASMAGINACSTNFLPFIPALLELESGNSEMISAE